MVPQRGTQTSPGTIVCTVTGSTHRHGVGEFAMGTPLRVVIDALGGGLVQGREIAAVLCGASGAPVLPAQLDLPLTYEDFAAAGLGLGSASFIVVDDQVPMGRIAASTAHFLAIESCGQCEPCKRDGLALDDLLHRAPGIAGRSTRASTPSTVARAARSPGRPSASSVRWSPSPRVAPGGTDWDDEVNAIVPLVEIVEGRAVLDVASAAKRADWSYPEDGPESGAWPAQHLADQPVRCARLTPRSRPTTPTRPRATTARTTRSTRCSPRTAPWRRTSTSCAGRRPVSAPPRSTCVAPSSTPTAASPSASCSRWSSGCGPTTARRSPTSPTATSATP